MAALSPADWLNQLDALIVAQRVDAQARLVSYLLNRQSCFHITSIEPGVHSRSRGYQPVSSFLQALYWPLVSPVFWGCAPPYPGPMNGSRRRSRIWFS